MSIADKSTVAYIVSMPNGLDRWTFEEIDELVGNGIEVTVFTLKHNPGPYMPKLRWRLYQASRYRILLRQPLWIVRFPLRYFSLLYQAIRSRSVVDFLIAHEFAHEMSHRNIRLIHCVFGDHKLFVGYYCKQIMGIPLTAALYGYDLQDNPNWRMFSRTIQDCDAIIVNCDYNKRLLARLTKKTSSPRTEIIRHSTYLRPEDTDTKIRLLMVGGFEERKGHDILFRAVGALGNEAKDLELWIAGYPGPVDIDVLAGKYGIHDKVTNFGWVSDAVVNLLYDSCDIFCLPSKTDSRGVSEGLPVALIEAMAHGKPVIATKFAGIPELVESILIDEGDVVGLATAIRQLVQDSSLRDSLGARNREIVRADYSRSNVLELNKVFNDVIGRYDGLG